MALLLHRVPSRYAGTQFSRVEDALSALRITLNQTDRYGVCQQKRNSAHQTQGVANRARRGPGKRLGAKKTGGEYVVPGNILFKQRGTLWFPGENCHMGRNHTIHASAPGYVRYYRDPAKHPKRQYIGVALYKDTQLPRPVDAPQQRRLGMLAYAMATPPPITEPAPISIETETVKPVFMPGMKKNPEPLVPRLRPRGYMYRVGNWELGREAERVGTAQSVAPFEPNNRWRAWRRRVTKQKRRSARIITGKADKKSRKQAN